MTECSCDGPFGFVVVGAPCAASTGAAVRSGRALNEPVRFGAGVVAAPAVDVRARVALRGAAFFAFFVVAFRAVVFAAFFAAVFFAVVFLVVAFLVAAFFVVALFVVALFVVALFVVAFLVVAFLVVAFLVVAFFAVAFFAAGFFAVAFFAVAFFAAAFFAAAFFALVRFAATFSDGGLRPGSRFAGPFTAGAFFAGALRVVRGVVLPARLRADDEGRVGDMAGSLDGCSARLHHRYGDGTVQHVSPSPRHRWHDRNMPVENPSR